MSEVTRVGGGCTPWSVTGVVLLGSLVIGGALVGGPWSGTASGPLGPVGPPIFSAPHVPTSAPSFESRMPLSVANGTEPAPMGLADFGRGAGGAAVPYFSTSFLGTAAIQSLTTLNASLGSESANVSLQLNAFVLFSYGGATYVYWTQVVLELNTTSHAATFFDNVWNATSTPYPVLAASALSGSGTFTTYVNDIYYGYGAPCSLPGACTVLVYPRTVSLRLNATLSSGGTPEVSFAFEDGFGFQTFDTVSFLFAANVTGFEGFVVNPTLVGPSCARCVADAELVLGGPSSGYQTSLLPPSALTLGLYRWNGHNYEAVRDASNYGVATAEGVSGAGETVASRPDGEPLAQVVASTGTLGSLWSSGSIASVEISVATGTSGGTLEINGTAATRFVGTSVELTLLPGTYDLTVISGSSAYPLGPVNLSAGMQLTLQVGGLPVVFVPAGLPIGTPWTVTLNGTVLTGTGNLTFGEQPGSYNYTISPLSGYTSSPSNGNLTVGTPGANLTVQWSKNQGSWLDDIKAFFLTPVGPVPAYTLFLALGAGILIAAGVARRLRKRRVAPWRPPQ